MSEVAASPGRPRRGRWVDLLVTAVIGLVVVSAALLPAITARSGETLTVQGDVVVNGEVVVRDYQLVNADERELVARLTERIR